MEGLTRSLAQELPKGMAAIAFNPGVINTDMLQSTFGQQALSYPNPKDWAVEAVNRLENLSVDDNGSVQIHKNYNDRNNFAFLSKARRY